MSQTRQITESELARQREYERLIFQRFAEREAHPVALVDTFGCQQNVADGERIAGMLKNMGFSFTKEPGEADGSTPSSACLEIWAR